MSMQPRLLWLDAAKALGIAAVVFGHVHEGAATRYAFLWHMPFFFFLAGYVFKSDADLPGFAREKAIRLLIPYAIFLVLLSQPDLAITAQAGAMKDWLLFGATRLAGGKSLYGWLGAFWFVTCLYLTQVAVNAGVVRLKPPTMAWTMAACLVLAYANSLLLPKFWLPWAAHLCLLAAPVFYAGYRYRAIEARMPAAAHVALAAVAVLGLLGVAADVIPVFDMKRARYGMPLVTLFIALCISLSLMNAARRWLNGGRLARALAFVGEASLLIMFLHQAVQRLLVEQFNVHDEFLRMAAALLVPTLLYAGLRKLPLGRALLLGSPRDFRALSHRRLRASSG